MPATLSRLELYDLVWSKPRTELANELGVSDVAIGKYCRKSNIPAPPPGYWAKLHSGRSVSRIPLPLRLPGQADTVEVGRTDYRHWYDQARSHEPLVAPTFSEDVEAQVQAAAKVIGRVAASRDLGAPDPALAKVLAKEARLREEGKTWSYKKPLFDSVTHQRQLRIFNSLARAIGSICGPQEVRVVEEWIQGLGHVAQLRLHLSFGGVGMELKFLEPTDSRRIKGWKAVKGTTLQVGGPNTLVGVQEWCDAADEKLEKQLTSIVLALLRRAELSLRAMAENNYGRQLQIREEARAEEEARAAALEAEQVAAVRAAEAKIQEEIFEVARRRSMAEDIRATVKALLAHPEASGPEKQRFQAWVNRALAIADSIDPLRAPLAGVLGTFECGDNPLAHID